MNIFLSFVHTNRGNGGNYDAINRTGNQRNQKWSHTTIVHKIQGGVTMILSEKERTTIEDLQTQEKACVDKYRFYEQSAHDEELKNLFHRIGDEEQEHFDSLGMVLKGDVPNVSAARSGMEGYTPSESYAAGNNSEEKKHDQFLCTDCIATEKLVSSTYNDDVFRFSASNIRRLLNHIQTEEQNHAEMIYKYKTANNMA